jgi:hypothetical protein
MHQSEAVKAKRGNYLFDVLVSNHPPASLLMQPLFALSQGAKPSN